MSRYHTPSTRTGTTGYARCFESHKPLPIGEYLIYGGSCSSPMVSNADIYVGFDMSMKRTPKRFPWNEGEDILYYIPDMGVPEDPAEFKRFIAWLALQLTALKLVHIGCIGGHGRTGTVLAALVTHMTGELDSISYVRKHYCEKAVESSTQVRFLHTHFGITEVKGCKEYSGGHGSKDWYSAKGYPTVDDPHMTGTRRGAPPKVSTAPLHAEPTNHPMCIWGSEIKFGKSKKSDIIKTNQEGVNQNGNIVQI